MCRECGFMRSLEREGTTLGRDFRYVFCVDGFSAYIPE